ncbi:MAG: PLP-dependent aminotransferase family protein [Acidobacteria bacterium]|nr:PLP-dependent aminotransferase family protein [Acidobacteriota bacterium]
MEWKELAVDAASPVPLYRQLHDHIAEWIHGGRLPDGAKLLPTRELAGLLGLNRTTVNAAYEILEKEGLLQAHVGRGSYVCAPRHAATLDWESRFRGAAPDPDLQQALWTSSEDFISFSSSRPDQEIFPFEAVSRAAAHELKQHGDAILQLGAAEGYPPLREFLHSQMREEGVAGAGDELLVTSGCQQGLDLVAKILVAPGDTVLLEDPVYPGARDLFLAAGAQVRGIAVARAGLSISELEQELSRHHPRLLVVTPSFQNPTGATIPLDARRELLALAARYGVVVVENDVYAGLRYHGDDVATLKSLDGDGRVIYLRSFSKVAFPGLRVGWCVAPRAVVRRLIAAKQLTDLHTDQLSQAVLYRLAEEGSLAAHRRVVLRHGALRLEAAVKTCRAEMPAGVEFLAPDGGMHLWLQLPAPLDSGELLARARAQKVLFIPGKFFAVSRSHHRALRLSFASLTPDKIRRGVGTLARLIRAQSPAPAEMREGVPALV